MTLPHEINPKIEQYLKAIDDFANNFPSGVVCISATTEGSPLKALKDYQHTHMRNHTCSNCETTVLPNKYKGLTYKEYFISALCKKCQKYFFQPPPEEAYGY